MSNAKPLSVWMSVSIVGLLAGITNIAILKRERIKRKSSNILFTTKWLKLWSLLCIIAGTGYTIICSFSYLPLVCKFSGQLQLVFISSQVVFMGFYQLNRLYYCFAKNQIHSNNKGYPNYLFIIMYLIGFLIFIISNIHPWIGYDQSAECGINNKYEYYSNQLSVLSHRHPLMVIINSINTLIYLLWDITTLILYAIKALSFNRYKSEQNSVYERIMSILKKIVILTVFYEIPVVLTAIVGIFLDILFKSHTNLMYIIYISLWLLTSVTINYSIFLMQRHNEDEYHTFLKYFCLCCSSRMKVSEINDNTAESPKTAETAETFDDIPFKERHSIIIRNSIPTLMAMEISENSD